MILVRHSAIKKGVNLDFDIPEDLTLDVNTSRKGTEGESSTGLGLIICKDLIEKLGVELWVKSNEGEGAEFHFTFCNN